MTETVPIRVQLFAAARDLAGAGEVVVDVSAVPTVGMLRQALAIQVPALAALLGRSAIAVNHDFADDRRTIGSADEVAVIPPVSGG
jgi:molybdopterin converting factor subunit 1